MQKTVLSLIALTGAICFPPANASSIAKITAIESSVWVQQNNTKTALKHDSDLKIGDQIITSENGRVELQLWSNVTIQLDTNSEIRILAQKSSEAADPDHQPELYIHQGRACINNHSQPDTVTIFKLNLGNSLIAAIHRDSHICVLQKEGFSSVNLRDGSVQITQSIDQSIIILSEVGTEFRLDDDGSYELLFPSTDDSFTVENEAPLATEEQVVEAITEDEVDIGDGDIPVFENVTETEVPVVAEEKLEEESPDDEVENVDTDIAVIDESEANLSKSDPDKNKTEFIYTVYLFSTRSETVANRVNKKFQNAGHETIILVTEKESLTRYRIAVPGFKSLQSAKEFSSSIVGKLGISGAWIGKDRQNN